MASRSQACGTFCRATISGVQTGSPPKTFPAFPTFPAPDPGGGEMGNVGKGGKDIPVNEVASSNFKKAKADLDQPSS